MLVFGLVDVMICFVESEFSKCNELVLLVSVIWMEWEWLKVELFSLLVGIFGGDVGDLRVGVNSLVLRVL